MSKLFILSLTLEQIGKVRGKSVHGDFYDSTFVFTPQLILQFILHLLTISPTMDDINKLYTELLHLSRLSLTGRKRDVHSFIRNFARKTRSKNPEIAAKLNELLAGLPNDDGLTRGSTFESIPVDSDSRLQLARIEYPANIPVEPVWTPSLKESLEQVVKERDREADLLAEGLHPTKSILLTGPPGVGKSLAAAWIATQLDRPLVVLDLSAVMSSFLGRTGNNLRNVLDYAKSIKCVLLLDEFDAIAKRRDDAGEIGELKRLVTVLLQEIDDFPPSGLLIAATNHPDLLDPAVWRRFELVLSFPMPSESLIRRAIDQFLPEESVEMEEIKKVLTLYFKDTSFSDIQRSIQLLKRGVIVGNTSLIDGIESAIADMKKGLNTAEKAELSVALTRLGMSQRRIEKITGISRKTVSKHSGNKEAENGETH